MTPLSAGEAKPARLRILFDAYELAPGTGKSIGIYNYARHLFQALLALQRPDIALVLVCNGAALGDFLPQPDGVRGNGSGPRSPAEPQVELRVLASRPPGKAQRLRWLAAGAASACYRLDADIYFSPKGFLPFGIGRLSPRTRRVVTLHDLIPLWYRERHPGYFGRFEQWFVCASLERSARRADEVITISQASAKDIVARTATRRPLHVIYNGLAAADPATPARRGDYLFAVSSPLPHKNLDTLLAGYRHYRSLVGEPLPLLLCGVPDPGIEGVQVTGRLSDAELNACYAGARLFIFLSLTEGFGFPPLEAMAHGVPVLCSDIEVLREVTRGAAHYVPAQDALAVGRQLAALSKPDAAPTAVDRMLQRAVAERYSWAACASAFLAVVAGQGGASPTGAVAATPDQGSAWSS